MIKDLGKGKLVREGAGGIVSRVLLGLYLEQALAYTVEDWAEGGGWQYVGLELVKKEWKAANVLFLWMKRAS